ncbi:MAG TPA: DUF5602 domain-containing protein, partial [Gammaproteobacteria bacterium]
MSFARRSVSVLGITVAVTLAVSGLALAQQGPASYAGPPVALGNGTAYTVVRTGPDGRLASIGVEITAPALEGLPAAAPGGHAMFPYHLAMPAAGPQTVIDHVGLDWEALGHPPAGVYDVPHFDFHFYLVDRAEVERVHFDGPDDSASPAQQPPAELLPAGYVLPPGTAVPKMGVHAVNPAAAEFQQKPFEATFIYGYYDRQLTFIEPMVSLAYLQSRPDFSAPVP